MILILVYLLPVTCKIVLPLSPGTMSKVVTISYNDILANIDLTDKIEAAFGLDGLGLILIKDYPDFQTKRKDVLNAIRKFGSLPEGVKEKYVHTESNYSVGWSHGKEKMRNGK